MVSADQRILARVPVEAGLEPDRILDVISTAQLLGSPGPQQGAVTDMILPSGGGDGVLMNNGNGTSTLFNPDGEISTVPSAR